MIELTQAFREAEACGEKFDILDFKCEYCHQPFNSFSFNLSVFLYGAFFLTGIDICYAGITCPKCLKTILMKGNTLARIKQEIQLFIGPDNRYYYPDYRYHSSVLFSPAQFDQLQEYNIRTLEIQLDEDFSRQLDSYLQGNPELEKDYLTSFKFVENIPIGTMASIWWYKPEDIEPLAQIENEYQIRVFPRYVHNLSWYEKYDQFCWTYKILQEYWVEREKVVERSNELLREYAREENINLDKLYEDDPEVALKGFTANFVIRNDEDEMMLAPRFIDLVINSDSDTQDIVFKTMDVYKNLWRAKSPFQNKQVPMNVDSLDEKKITPGMSENEFKAVADEIRPFITKSHVQEWAIDNHQRFIDDFVALARQPDFSYGYVWELKCRYLKSLHDNLDKGSIKEARFAFYQTGPTWTIIFNGNEITGLKQDGHKYILYLIKRPNEEFPTFDMEALQCFSVREMYGEKGSKHGKKAVKVLSEEERIELYGDKKGSAKWNPLSQIEAERYEKELKGLKEYRDIIQKHENMEDGEPGSSDIDPELLKEAKKAVNRFLKEYENRLKFGNVVYEKKEMFKKEQQRVAKSIERAVKEIKKYDAEAYQHFLDALSPINTRVQCYKATENISWETK